MNRVIINNGLKRYILNSINSINASLCDWCLRLMLEKLRKKKQETCINVYPSHFHTYIFEKQSVIIDFFTKCQGKWHKQQFLLLSVHKYILQVSQSTYMPLWKSLIKVGQKNIKRPNAPMASAAPFYNFFLLLNLNC